MRAVVVVTTAALFAASAAAFPIGSTAPTTPPAPATTTTSTGAPATAKCEATAADHVRVMLLDLKATARLSSSAKSLGQIVAEEAGKVRGYSILSADEVRSALDQEANKQLVGCTETSCLAELAQALDATFVVGGNLDETPDGSPIVSLTLLNTRALVVINRVTMTWGGDPQKLPDVVHAAAQTLMLDRALRPPGAIVLQGVPLGGRVVVDGVDRTADANNGGGRIAGLDIGPHELRVEAQDKTPFVAWAIVKAGETQTVGVTLDDVAVPTAWLWIGGAGAVVVGAGAAIGIAYALGQSDVALTAQVPAFGPNDVDTVAKSGHR